MKKSPFFLYLLPAYFFLWAADPYIGFVQPGKVVWPVGIALVVAALLHAMAQRIQKGRAAVYISLFLWFAAFLFFGAIKDTLPAHSLLASYRLFVPILVLLPFGVAVIIRKRETLQRETMLYLNCLMLLLSVMALGKLAWRILQKTDAEQHDITLKPDRTGQQPSVYFVLFDEYPGQQALWSEFQFDNDCHREALERKRFFIFDSLYSNYDQTVYSVNSMLNMHYPDPSFYQPFNAYSAYLKNFRAIRNNYFTGFLQQEGYAIHNLSLFDVQSAETPYTFSHLPSAEKLLLRTTLPERFSRDLLWKFYTGPYRMEWLYQREVMHVFHQNEDIIQALKNLASSAKRQPVCCFAHLLLPHEPYYCDSSGKVYDMEKEMQGGDTKEKFVQYLQYTNRRMLGLADTLLRDDPGAIIVFFSDHGYRDVPDEKAELRCNNFMAVHLPDGEYRQLKQVRSNVNVFRVLLNQYFGAELPLLPDSSFRVLEAANRLSVLQPHYRSK